jgi:hypothetical protein
MIPFSTHSLALDCEEKSPMIAFQKDIYLCGCNGKSEEIYASRFLLHSSGNGS